MTTSKLGAYCLTNHPDWKKFVGSGSVVIKSVNDIGLLRDAKAMNPKVLTVAIYSSGIALGPGLDPIKAADAWTMEMEPRFRDAGGVVDYWETLNEPPMDSLDDLNRWVAFTKRVIENVRTKGAKLAIGSFSTGVPDISFWSHLKEIVQMAVSEGHVLALHSYSWPDMRWMTGAWQLDPNDQGAVGVNGKPEGWTTLRYRKVLKELGLPDVKILLTEVGIDPQVQPKPFDGGGAYRDLADGINEWCGAPQDRDSYYANNLMWYDQQLQMDKEVLGAVIFTIGSFQGKWDGFDIAGTPVVDYLCEYIAGKRQFQPYPEREVDPSPNLFVNPDFTLTVNGTASYAANNQLTHLPKQELSIPNAWFFWYNPDEKTVPADSNDHYYPPETRPLRKLQMSRVEQISLFSWFMTILKVFAGMKPIDWIFGQLVVVLKPGVKYGFLFRLRPDLYQRNAKTNASEFVSDPSVFRFRLLFNGKFVADANGVLQYQGESTPWQDGHIAPNGKWTKLQAEFVAKESTGFVGIQVIGRLGLTNNGYFIAEKPVLWEVTPSQPVVPATQQLPTGQPMTAPVPVVTPAPVVLPVPQDPTVTAPISQPVSVPVPEKLDLAAFQAILDEGTVAHDKLTQMIAMLSDAETVLNQALKHNAVMSDLIVQYIKAHNK